MTPKDKAKELVIEKFGSGYPIICKMNSRNMYRSEAKQCALIAVDEILKLDIYSSDQWYWQEIKKEIEKL